MNKLKSKAFTLAEVLLTLAIVGIVAALTIPSLMYNTQKEVWKTQYKSAFRDASIAYQAMIGNSQLTSRNSIFDTPTSVANFNEFKSYFVVTQDCPYNTTSNANCWKPKGDWIIVQGQPDSACAAFIDSKGRVWSQYAKAENIIYVDVDGATPPNQFGKDRWVFTEWDVNQNRMSSGLPVNIGPFNNFDQTWLDQNCHYPTCNYRSWLTDN